MCIRAAHIRASIISNDSWISNDIRTLLCILQQQKNQDIQGKYGH